MGYAPKPGKDQAPVGFLLRLARTKCNRSQEAWAVLMGVGVRTISRWESGEKIPTQPELFAWRYLLNQPGNRSLIHLYPDAELELLDAGLVDPWVSVRAA